MIAHIAETVTCSVTTLGRVVMVLTDIDGQELATAVMPPDLASRLAIDVAYFAEVARKVSEIEGPSTGTGTTTVN